MWKLFSSVLILIFSISVYSEETLDNPEFLLIETADLKPAKSYTQKELKKLFGEMIKKPTVKSRLRTSKVYVNGMGAQLAYGEPTNSPSDDLNCYRCGLMKSEYISKDTCEVFEHQWGAKDLVELNNNCN